MEWQKEQCTERPSELDFESSPGFVIERRNIAEVTTDDSETSEPVVYFECEMRFIPVKEYIKYINTLKLRQEDTENTVLFLLDVTLGGV